MVRTRLVLEETIDYDTLYRPVTMTETGQVNGHNNKKITMVIFNKNVSLTNQPTNQSDCKTSRRMTSIQSLGNLG